MRTLHTMNLPRLSFTALALALALPAGAAAQGSFTVDEALAKRGKKVWENTGCMICHRFGARAGSGPDMNGLFERRSAEWVTRFLKNTTEMLESDSIAIALYEDFKRIKMPQIKLTDSDIQAVMHYIAQEGAKDGT
jgi:hypothetical protein